MKPAHLLALTFLAPFALAAPSTDYENSIACGKRNPTINTAIEKFCNRRNAAGAFVNDVVVPSPYASKGAAVNGAKVWITGTCKPKQWVPLQYCAPQLSAMCAQGVGERKFGRNECQVWRIKGVGGGRVGGIVGGIAGAADGVRKGVENLVGRLRGG